jgi:hypothetical protein
MSEVMLEMTTLLPRATSLRKFILRFPGAFFNLIPFVAWLKLRRGHLLWRELIMLSNGSCGSRRDHHLVFFVYTQLNFTI